VEDKKATSGFFKNGLAYNRSGSGPCDLIVFKGLTFENKPEPILFSRSYKFLWDMYTVYEVSRKPDLPEGYSLENMADDYAQLIRDEFKPPMDIIGISTGGSIAQVFAARHPDLVQRLVIQSSACKLTESARKLQKRIARQASEKNWVGAYSWLFDITLPKQYPQRLLMQLVFPFIAWSYGRFGAPITASDLVITVEAEDGFYFKNHLAEIKAPTLVVAGMDDPLYTVDLFRETAEGIPGAKLALYPGVGHPAKGTQFETDVRKFLA
jgi:pimeloyl-ACP methyl ester carboxylesterase